MRQTPINYKKYDCIVGIDPGVKTGICAYWTGNKKITELLSLPIHEAMDRVKAYAAMGRIKSDPDKVFIRLEDARKRQWFGKSGREVLQGAGSIKRDCKIWEDFLKSINVEFELVAPKSNKTKLNAETFKKLSKFEGKTNEHSRDAAMLVIGL